MFKSNHSKFILSESDSFFRLGSKLFESDQTKVMDRKCFTYVTTSDEKSDKCSALTSVLSSVWINFDITIIVRTKRINKKIWTNSRNIIWKFQTVNFVRAARTSILIFSKLIFFQSTPFRLTMLNSLVEFKIIERPRSRTFLQLMGAILRDNRY